MSVETRFFVKTTNARRVRQIVALSLASFVTIGCGRHSSDEVMIARFRGHRQEFLKLLDMAKADAAVITILAGDVLVTNTKTVDLSDSSAVTNQDQLPADRLAAYLHLMNAAGIHGLLKGRDVVEFRIEPASESIGDHKGIFFSTEPMKTCAAELEKCMPPRPEKFAFKLIEPDWYIYLATP